MKRPTGQSQAATEPEGKGPTRRALAKQQTRLRVLEAARRLFSEQGYEGATIRDIAAAAGMSTGAVFANFTDKTDLFQEIMLSDLEQLDAAMRAASERAESVEDALVGLFGAGYAYYWDQLPLARAAFSVSWSPEGATLLRAIPKVRALYDLIAELLQAGVSRGELVADPEVELRSDMLFQCYLSNFPQAIFAGATQKDLEERSREQIRILLAGVRRR